MHELIAQMLSGNKYALSKVISSVEHNGELLREVMRAAHANAGTSYSIGVTGPPGAGKSTLINALVKKMAGSKKKVAILAIDPNSPFTGGAFLGDRVRMSEIGTLDNVFIRSISNRDSAGGLSISAYFIVKVFEACGYDYIFVETVGVGQSEIKIMNVVDTTIITLAPGLGDDIQALKAGVLEIANIFVINKKDKDGAIRLQQEMKEMQAAATTGEWIPPVVMTNAIESSGIDELIFAMDEHRKAIATTDITTIQRDRLKAQCIEIFERQFHNKLIASLDGNEDLEDVFNSILVGNSDSSQLVDINEIVRTYNTHEYK